MEHCSLFAQLLALRQLLGLCDTSAQLARSFELVVGLVHHIESRAVRESALRSKIPLLLANLSQNQQRWQMSQLTANG